MFRDDRQISMVAQALLRSIRRGELWTRDGPTPVAVEYLQQGCPLSHGEKLILCLCFDLWNGSGRAPAGELVKVLDATRLGRVGALFIALATGPVAIDDWVLDCGDTRQMALAFDGQALRKQRSACVERAAVDVVGIGWGMMHEKTEFLVSTRVLREALTQAYDYGRHSAVPGDGHEREGIGGRPCEFHEDLAARQRRLRTPEAP